MLLSCWILVWQKRPPKADNSCVKYSGLWKGRGGGENSYILWLGWWGKARTSGLLRLTAQTQSTHSKCCSSSPFISTPALSSSNAGSQVEDLTELSILNSSPRGEETLGKVTAEWELVVLLHISVINSALQFQELSSKCLLPPLKISV